MNHRPHDYLVGGGQGRYPEEIRSGSMSFAVMAGIGAILFIVGVLGGLL